MAEAAGADSVWVSEDPFHWDALAILGALALGTTRIRLGPGITSPYVRPPHLQAMSMTTLDKLSGGRAFWATGRGLTQWYQRLLSMDTGDPVSVMEESIGLLRQWWHEPYEATSRGDFFQVAGLRREVGGAQAYLPIYLAAVGPRMVQLAARLADGLVFSWPSFEYLERTIKMVKEEILVSGRSTDNFAFVVQTGLKVTLDRERVLEEVKDQMAVIHTLPGVENALISLKYDVPKIIDELRRAMKAKEILAKGGWMREFRQYADFAAARRAIPTGLVEEVAIVGEASQIRSRLACYQALGVTHIFAPPPQEQTSNEYRNLLVSIDPSPEDI